MKRTIFNLLPAIFLWIGSCYTTTAQGDPSGSVPDEASTAMSVEATDAVIATDDSPRQEDVAGDPSYSPPQGPYVPESPDSGSNYDGPVGVTGIFNGNVTTGCSYDPVTRSTHRVIDDIVVPGSIGKYPLKMTRYYNSRQQYYALNAIGLGPGWSHEYAWLLWGAGHRVISPHGNVHDDYCGRPVGVSEGWEQRTDQYNGTWRLADGGKIIFVNGRVTYIDDPYGQRTTIYYDENGRRSKVQEPGGRYLQFFYGPAADDDGTVLLTRVEAHGLGNATVTDWVNYSYTSVSPGVQGRNKKMLTRVDYADSNPNNLNDNTHAHYTYCNDNVAEGLNTYKIYPLLQRCDDVRYNGPMRTIRYEYLNGTQHGIIANEKCPNVGAISAITPGPDTFTETRGDGPSRSFTYTHLGHAPCPPNEACGPCDDYDVNDAYPYRAPNQMLLVYTDFQGHSTTLGYDPNWYISSVTDANNHTTRYERGPAPPTPNATPGPEHGIGQITKIIHPDNTYIQYTYENEGPGHISGHYVMSIRDERGNMTVHTRDGNHRITRTDYKDATGNILAYETFSYCDQADSQCNNTFGQLKRHRLKNGAYVHYQYDSRGRLTAKWNPTTNPTAQAGDPKITYTYWTNSVWADRLYRETFPANVSSQVASETYEYDRNEAGNAVPGRGLVKKITHADNTYQSFGYSQFGNKIWEENELRQRTTYTYDNYNRVLSVSYPLNITENFSYIKPGTSSSYLHTTNSVYTHTSRGRMVTKNVYDQNWRKTSTTAASGTLNLTTGFAYDTVGNLTDVTDPRSQITHHGYDNRNRKTSTTEAYTTPLANTTVWHYDPANNINKIDRPDGKSETKGYDALNRVTWHSVPRQVPGGNPINLITHFYYNPSGTLQKVKDAKGHDTTFDYDASDRRLRMTYAFPFNHHTQQWAYDNAGNLKSRTTVNTVNNETQNFTYDKRTRKIGMSWSNIPESATYGYDDASRLTSASNSNSAVTRVYDAAGRLTQDQQNVAGLGIKTVTYPLYDGDGKVKQISAAGVYDYTFGYDAAGRFETISTGGSTKFEYDYDAASNETHRYAYLSRVTIDQVYARDSLNRMSSRVLKKNGQTIPGSTEAYTYDRMNRLTGVNRGGVADSFGYYWSGELWTAQYGGGPQMPYTEGQDPDLDTTDTVDPNANYQPPDTPEAEPTLPPDDYSDLPGGGGPAPDLPGGRSVAYYLDRAGNRTQLNDRVNGGATYTLNNINQYTAVTGSAIINGPDHEISDYQGNHYTYINDERLTKVTSGSNTYDLKYDALGRCVKRVLNTTTITYYIYDGEKPILEYKSNDLTHPVKNVYGKGIDEILMRTETGINSSQPFYYCQDHEGSVTHLLNTSGDKIETYKYDAFGAPTFYNGVGNQMASTAFNNRFLFTGREYAATYRGTYVAPFKFYEYRARAYHPDLGRFMSEDPKLFVRRIGLGKWPDDWSFSAHPDEAEFNLFRYCGNDPIDFTDPMGLEVGFAESLIPVWGSGHMAYDALNEGHYGWAAFHAAMAISDVVPAKAGLTALGKAGVKAFTRKEVAAVIGKYPNYLKVAEQMGAKKFNIPANVWNKMSEAERWAANQKFLDRAIARGGDIMLDKPLKDISSVSGQTRKELDYLSQRGYQLSGDGSRMVRSTQFEASIEKGVEQAGEKAHRIHVPSAQ
jgi:RHS repeat-associated protein